jgi:hypothetical protein
MLRDTDWQLALTTAGGVRAPLRIEGLFSFGRYIRSMGMNWLIGAGSQLASFSAPGDSLWK